MQVVVTQHPLVQHAPQTLRQVVLHLGYLCLQVFVDLIKVTVLTVYLGILTRQLRLQLSHHSLTVLVLAAPFLQPLSHQLRLLLLLFQQHLQIRILLLQFVVLPQNLYFLLPGLLRIHFQFAFESTVQLRRPLLLLLQLSHLVEFSLNHLVFLV